MPFLVVGIDPCPRPARSPGARERGAVDAEHGLHLTVTGPRRLRSIRIVVLA